MDVGVIGQDGVNWLLDVGVEVYGIDYCYVFEVIYYILDGVTDGFE